MLAFAVALALVVMLPSSGSALPSLNQGCVLDKSGHPACSLLENRFHKPEDLAAVSRFRTCEDGNIECWNLKCVEITNEIRSRLGDGTKLIAGPKVMLDNAMMWSKHQMASKMQHQNPLPLLGCGTQVNRENVAWYSGWETDEAVQCMDQWEKSTGHRENILNAAPGSMVSVGIYKVGTKVFCTQTFSISPKGTGSCAPLGDTSGSAPPTRAPTPRTTAMKKPATVMTNAPATMPKPEPTRARATQPRVTKATSPPHRATRAPTSNTSRKYRVVKFCKWFLQHPAAGYRRYSWIKQRCNEILAKY